MLNHHPRFVRGAPAGLVPKLGGLPWGLPANLWPICAECGRPMSHLAQWPARPAAGGDGPELPLPDDAVLFAFKCEWDSVCSFWESDAGANHVFCVSRSQLGDAATIAPPHEDGEPELLPELSVVRWLRREDDVSAELEAHFYDYARHSDLPDELAHPDNWASEWRTKAGGVPYWTANGAQQIPPGRMLMQIDNWVKMDDGSTAEVANFCSDGTAFLFVDASQSPPAFSMIINR